MARITSLTAVDSFFCEDDQWQHGTRQRTVLNDEQLSVLIDATVVEIARLCGCSTVVSSAPAVTSAIADAHRAGITLIGALGDATFKLYAGAVDL